MGLFSSTKDLIVRIRGDKSHLDDTLKGSESSIRSFAGKASNWLKGAFAVTSIVAFAKAVIGASEALSDKLSFAIAGTKGALTEFLRMTATMNFDNFIKQLTLGYEKAHALAEALDALRDKSAYIGFVTSGKRQEASIQEEIVRDKTGKYTLDRRKKAAEDLKEIELEIKEMTKQALQDVYDLEARGWENRNKMTVEKGQMLYETVTNMSEMTRQSLEEIFKKADEVYGKTKDIFGAKAAFIRQKAGPISDETIQLYREYLNLMKSGEEDVIPKLYKILQSLNEGNIAAQERYNGVLRITNELLKEQAEGIRREAPITKAGTGNLTMPSFGMGELPGIQEPKNIDAITEGLTEAQQSLISLSDTFAGFFSDVNLGFQGMIDGVITGIKRLVAELIAKAVILSILSAITGVPMPALGPVLFGNAGKLFGGATGGTGVGNLVPAATGVPTAMGNQQLVATVRGSQLDFVLQQYYNTKS